MDELGDVDHEEDQWHTVVNGEADERYQITGGVSTINIAKRTRKRNLNIDWNLAIPEEMSRREY